MRDRSNAFSLSSCLEFRGKDSAGHGRPALAFPDRVIAVRVPFHAVQALSIEHSREPWVITPVHLDGYTATGLVEHEAAIDLVFLQLRVEADPYLAVSLADGGRDHIP